MKMKKMMMMMMDERKVHLVISLSGMGSRGWSGHTTHDVAPENLAPGGMQFK